MKIQVDTKADSHDDIRKVIKLLMSIVGSKNVYTNDTAPFKHTPNTPTPTPPDVNPLITLFDNTPAQNSPSPPSPQEQPEDDKKIPQIEVY